MAFLWRHPELDSRTICVVYGFSRKSSNQHVPDVIVDLLCVFYHIFESWSNEPLDIRMAINPETRRLTMVKDSTEFSFNHHAFGAKIVSAYPFAVHRWLLQVGGCAHVKIGLVACDSNGDFDKSYGSMTYAYNGMTGKQHRNQRKVDSAKKFSAFDVVAIELNTRLSKLKFCLNGKRQGKAMKTFGDDLNYKLVVAMRSKGNWVRILQYSKC